MRKIRRNSLRRNFPDGGKRKQP